MTTPYKAIQKLLDDAKVIETMLDALMQFQELGEEPNIQKELEADLKKAGALVLLDDWKGMRSDVVKHMNEVKGYIGHRRHDVIAKVTKYRVCMLNYPSIKVDYVMDDGKTFDGHLDSGQ